jgi:two-component system sensor histidine kinase ResE
MHSAPSPNPQDMNGSLRRIHHLGSATSELFSRLYAGLSRRSRLHDTRLALEQTQSSMQALAAQHHQALHRLEERDAEVERLYTILASLEDGIILQNTAGEVLLMNQAAVAFLGSEADFLSSDLAQWFREFQRMDSTGTDMLLMDRARRFEIGGRVLAASMALLAASDEEPAGTLLIVRDVTRDWQAQRLRDSVMTSISHELKTPMNVMRIASEILLSQPEDAPANRKMLEKISRNIDVLDRMIIELLDVSEMSSGSFDIRREPVNLEALLWEVLESFRQDVQQAKLEMTLMLRDAGQLQCLGDAPRLKWAIGHLLRNALAYTEAGGRIIIAARYSEREQALILKVRDTGAGIADQDVPHIFELFYRGIARNAAGKRIDPRGLGQGLFIVQRVAEAHGGRVQVETSVHEGSIFTLLLPVSRALPSAS